MYTYQSHKSRVIQVFFKTTILIKFNHFKLLDYFNYLYRPFINAYCQIWIPTFCCDSKNPSCTALKDLNMALRAPKIQQQNHKKKSWLATYQASCFKRSHDIKDVLKKRISLEKIKKKKDNIPRLLIEL